MRNDVVVVWTREERGETRASGAAAWSQRLKLVPSETRLPQFIKAGANFLDSSPPYHLVSEIRHDGSLLWAASWHTDRIHMGGEPKAGVGSGRASERSSGRASERPSNADAETDDAGAPDVSDALGVADCRVQCDVVEVNSDDVPSEVWLMILLQVTATRDLCMLASVSTSMHQLVTLEAQIWDAQHERIFGLPATPCIPTLCVPSPPADVANGGDAVADGADGGGVEAFAPAPPAPLAPPVLPPIRRVIRSEAAMQRWRTRPDGGRVEQQQRVAPAVADRGRDSAAKGGGRDSHSSGRDGHISCSPGASSDGANSLGAVHAAAATPRSKRWTCFTNDASGGERRRAVDDESCSVRAVYFDGGGLLATADGGCVRLWSLERRRRICTLKSIQGKDELHAGGVSCIAVDGAQLLSGGGDGTLHLFDLDEISPAAALRAHAAPISDCALLPSGSHRARAVSSSVDGAVKLWDAAGGVVADLLPSHANHTPPAPLPIAVDVHGGATPRSLYSGRDGMLRAIDLQTEAPTSTVPLPGRVVERGINAGRPVLHVACATAEFGGGVGAPLIATCSLNKANVHIWDSRLLPAATAIDDATATFEDLSAASRRCLVATVNLPVGAACARQLYLDGARILASVDADHTAPAFSRGAQSAALFDMRALSANNSLAPGQPRSAGCLLWEQPVRGDISCLQCRGERVLVGTATGAVYLWHFGASSAEVLMPEWDGANEQLDKKPKREKFRAAGGPKVRGRFPKTQGFSNMKGFR